MGLFGEVKKQNEILASKEIEGVKVDVLNLSTREDISLKNELARLEPDKHGYEIMLTSVSHTCRFDGERKDIIELATIPEDKLVEIFNFLVATIAERKKKAHT